MRDSALVCDLTDYALGVLVGGKGVVDLLDHANTSAGSLAHTQHDRIAAFSDLVHRLKVLKQARVQRHIMRYNIHSRRRVDERRNV